MAISEDKKWVAVSEVDQVHILSGLKAGKLEEEQSIHSSDQFLAKFSKDSQYLLLGRLGEAMVFLLCDAKKDFAYNFESKFCEYCPQGTEDGQCIVKE